MGYILIGIYALIHRLLQTIPIGEERFANQMRTVCEWRSKVATKLRLAFSLGPPEFWLDDKEIKTFRTGKAQALLVYLAVHWNASSTIEPGRSAVGRNA